MFLASGNGDLSQSMNYNPFFRLKDIDNILNKFNIGRYFTFRICLVLYSFGLVGLMILYWIVASVCKQEGNMLPLHDIDKLIFIIVLHTSKVSQLNNLDRPCTY